MSIEVYAAHLKGSLMCPVRPSRREFLASTLKTGALFQADAMLSSLAHTQVPARNLTGLHDESSLLTVDLKRLVSASDLHYTQPVSRSEEGIPIGNGTTGSLVWTEPSTIRLQINRVDVFAEDCSTNSFPERHSDYASDCGYVDLDFGDFEEEVFSGPAFNQHLNVYDGISAVSGNGVSARALACVHHDVLAIEVDDHRTSPGAVNINLRMLRYAMQYLPHQNYDLMKNHSVKVTNRNHSAISTLGIREGDILLTQKFEEGNYYNASAVAIRVTGRTSKAKYANDVTVRLAVDSGAGRWTVLIASASSFDRGEDIGGKALAQLDVVAARSFDELVAANRGWWHNFWSRSFVRLTGPGSAPSEIQKNYTYYLYVMGASSRGSYMPRFGGMLWYTNGDMREWGSQYWWSNQSCYYNALPPANRPEVMAPMFATYSGISASCARAAREQWGSQGIYIPETSWFNGLAPLPADLQTEIRDLFLLKKPWREHSHAFYYLADTKLAHNSRWNWKLNGRWIDGHWVWKDRGCGPYGPVTHIFSSSAKIAYLYWVHYEHTQDRGFLQERAYPMLKGVAEFYRNHPNFQLGADGKYHILHVNNSEPVWGARDTQEEISAMMGIFPVAARASLILGVDAGLRSAWLEARRKLAPLPTNTSPGAPSPKAPDQPEVWISGLPPVLQGNIGAPRLLPALSFDLCCVETADERMVELGQNTFNAVHPNGIDPEIVLTVLSTDSTAAAHLGRAEDMPYLLMNQIVNSDPGRGYCDSRGSGPPSILANRMTLREGPGAIGIERLGRMAEALHEALLQSNPPYPGGDPVVHVFPAWPREWDAQFTLSARGGHLVTSSFTKGAVEFVEVKGRAPGVCRLRNPWRSGVTSLYRNGKHVGQLHGDLFEIPLTEGEVAVIAPLGSTLAGLRRSV